MPTDPAKLPTAQAVADAINKTASRTGVFLNSGAIVARADVQGNAVYLTTTWNSTIRLTSCELLLDAAGEQIPMPAGYAPGSCTVRV